MGRTNLRKFSAISISILGIICTVAAGRMIYVDADANGANDGSSWANAYKYLQDAIGAAQSGDEIRVAQGTYKPDQGAGITPGDRTATFQLIDGVAISGGYAGLCAPDPNVRDIESYETILSGDVNGDDIDSHHPLDLWDEPTRAENSLHVVTGSGTDGTAVLDGFIITAGNGRYSEGAGMHNVSGSPTVRNCVFLANSTSLCYDTWFGGVGGGMCNTQSHPTLVNCRFTRNLACWGGGMSNYKSSPILKNCTFKGNVAQADGAGMDNGSHCSPMLTDCVFRGNWAGSGGGGMHNDGFGGSCTPALVGCIFAENTANSAGGGMRNWRSAPSLNNCVFTGNLCKVSVEGINVGGLGGGIANLDCSPMLNNCVLTGNKADVGGAMHNDFHSNPILINCTFNGNRASVGGGICCESDSSATVKNTIMWADQAIRGSEIYLAVSVDYYGMQHPSTIEVSYSDIEAGQSACYIEEGCTCNWGASNIDTDPFFEELGYWDPNGTSDDPNDDFWVDGDYHLKSQAGRWDEKEGRWTKDDVTSPCVDAGDLSTPIGYEPFPNGGRINMGAYGGKAEASKSYFGEPVCETIVAGDINGDCKVDFVDFLIMALHWLEDKIP